MSRYVHAFLRDAQEPEVREFLTQAYSQQEDPWILGDKGDARLYIWLYRTQDVADNNDLGEPNEVQRLIDAFDGLPSLMVSVQVSGRHEGTAEVKQFLNLILNRFTGLAEDEYVPALWTLEEINAGVKKETEVRQTTLKLPFFAYKDYR